MAFDNAYEALVEDNDVRWAFGTSFTDPLGGVDTTVPDGVDGGDLAAYCLMLGDDALIMSHRLQEWVTRCPELEDEVAVANIALDLLGQARLLLARAGKADAGHSGGAASAHRRLLPDGAAAAHAMDDEDALAYLRDAGAFRNVAFVEAPQPDFAHLVARLTVLAAWRLALLERLTASRDPVLAAIAGKGVKELTYHRDYAARWVVRLGDGTAVSHERMQAAVDVVWPEAEELLQTTGVERRLAAAGVAVDPADLRGDLQAVLEHVLAAARLRAPAADRASGPGGARPWRRRGRLGDHSPAFVALLAELQGTARAHPGAVW